MEYRTNLGIDKDQTFGVEIEFADAKLSAVKTQSEKAHLPIKYITIIIIDVCHMMYGT